MPIMTVAKTSPEIVLMLTKSTKRYRKFLSEKCIKALKGKEVSLTDTITITDSYGVFDFKVVSINHNNIEGYPYTHIPIEEGITKMTIVNSKGEKISE